MVNNEAKKIERIRERYTEREVSKLDELQALNKRVERPAQVFAYTFGTAGALVMGTGMSLAMKVIGASLSYAMPLGVAIGVIGLCAVTGNYFLYKKLLNKRKKKYREQILAMTDELLRS